MRIHQASQKKSSPQISHASTPKPLASRPFVVQQVPDVGEPSTPHSRNLGDFAVFNPEVEPPKPHAPKMIRVKSVGAASEGIATQADSHVTLQRQELSGKEVPSPQQLTYRRLEGTLRHFAVFNPERERTKPHDPKIRRVESVGAPTEGIAAPAASHVTLQRQEWLGKEKRKLQTNEDGSRLGNFSVRHLEGGRHRPLQPKLTIGKPGDKYEQEADRVAALVVNQINVPGTQQTSQPLQRQEKPESEELQMKPIVQLQAGESGMTATPDLESSIQQARSGGHPLTETIRTPMERAFGADFSGVKVHTDAQADQLNRSIQARAFTTGQDVFFRQGEYNPGSRGGQELIAHELTHVVQQNDSTLHRQPPTLRKISKSLTHNHSQKPTIQRWVVIGVNGIWKENGQPPEGHVPLQNYWEAFRQDLWEKNDTEYRQRVHNFYNDQLAQIQESNTISITGDIHKVNDMSDIDGCTNCVAADYLKIPLSIFQARYQLPLTGRNGEEANEFFNKLGIVLDFEQFDNVQKLKEELQKNPDGEKQWEVALAWEGHIVRGRITYDQIALWDPQGQLNNYLLPPSKSLTMWTLK